MCMFFSKSKEISCRGCQTDWKISHGYLGQRSHIATRSQTELSGIGWRRLYGKLESRHRYPWCNNCKITIMIFDNVLWVSNLMGIQNANRNCSFYHRKWIHQFKFGTPRDNSNDAPHLGIQGQIQWWKYCIHTNNLLHTFWGQFRSSGTGKHTKNAPHTRHINIKFHHFRKYVHRKLIMIQSVRTNEQLADIFTNPLPCDLFAKFRDQIFAWDSKCLRNKSNEGVWEYKTDLTLILWHFTEEGQTSDAIMDLSAGLKTGNPPSLCSEICHHLYPHLLFNHSFSYDRSFHDLSLRYWVATSHAAIIWYIHSRLGMIPLVPCLMYTNWLPRSSSASLYIFSLNWALHAIIN